MRKFVLVALVAGCAESAPLPAQAPIQAPMNGAAPHVFVQVTGFAANEGKAARCVEVAQASGFIVDPAAPVQAVLTLEGGRNKLQIVSRARGIVRDEPLPGWDMGRLCRTAVEGILPVLAQEPTMVAAPPPQAYRPPPPSVQLAPAPTPYYPPPPPAVRPPPAPVVRKGPPSLLPPPPDAPRAVGELAAKGGKSYARGDYSAALTAFAEASRLSSAPALLFDTAVCYKMLNRPQEALQYLQLYLDREPTAPNRADAEALISEIRRARGDEE